MISNIENILSSIGFDVTVLQSDQLARLYTKNNDTGLIKSAFVVTDISGVGLQDVLVDIQSRISACLEALNTPGSLEKNTTLILLYEYASDQSEQTLRHVTEIEEDQYFFKKQVLFYTKTEKDLLTKLMTSGSPVSILEEILYDKTGFKKYSEGKYDGTYSIVTKMFAKLPFLTVQRAAQTRPDLTKAIRTELEQKNLITLRDRLLEIGGNEEEFDKWIEMVLKEEHL